MKRATALKWLAAVAIGASALAAYRVFGWSERAPTTYLGLDLADPDAVILTHSLAALPRDLLRIPLAREVLAEDFVYYYEQGADLLGLKGSLRRIAYEHQLGWGDEVLRAVLDQPAEVALWRDPDGTLKHYAIAISRSGLTRVLEEAAKVALKDSQLQRAGTLSVDGERVPLYALEHGYRQALLFAAHGERLLVLSHPGMLLDRVGEDSTIDPGAHAVARQLLARDRRQHGVLRARLQLAPQDPSAPASGHRVAVKADFLAFGYQPLFGALQALRFEFGDGAWRSQALVDAGKLGTGGYDSSALWAVLPHHPSACFSLPADWRAAAPLLARLRAPDGADLGALARRFDGPAAACWYGDSRLYTPVFVAHRAAASAAPSSTPSATATAAADDALLAGLFGALVGGEVRHASADGVRRWERTIETARGKFVPTLAVSGDTAVFSADPALVDAVLAVRRKQAAAARDHLPAPAMTIGLVDPAALARLVEKEAFDALPAAGEPVLRAAATTHLLPRLALLRRHPPYRMVLGTLPASGRAWVPLEWQAVR